MNKSTNYGMSLPQYNNVADIDVLNANINVIDNGLSPFYVAVVNSSNTYKVTTGINKTSLANGYSIKVAIPSDSNGAVSVIIDTCNAVPVKKPNGNAVTNFKQNGVYSLTYYNSVFILASGGVDDVNFSASDLLSGKTANNSDGEKVTGTMPNIGQQTATINASGKVTISKGYHDGTGYVQSNSMGTQLSNLGATLTSASQLVSGVKAVDKNGNLITGTATITSLGGLELRTGTISINNTNLRDNTYSLQLSQLNLPRTPKFVICDWELTYRRNAQYNKLTEFTESSYTFFDFINSKCCYPTNTMWSHDNSGTYKIVDTIRNFTDKSNLCMHVERDNRYLIPTIDGYEDSNFSRDPMRVFWTAFV